MTPNYWRIKSASLERAIRIEQLKSEAAKADAVFAAVMRENGFDPALNYKLTDTNEMVVLVPPGSNEP